jgi:uncharacterized protein (DUF1330 family)
MAAYMIVQSHLRNRDWIENYLKHVPAMIKRHGGVYVTVGQDVKVLEGTADRPDAVSIFKFPSLEAIDNFRNSEEYRPFRELRQQWSDAVILAFESIPAFESM